MSTRAFQLVLSSALIAVSPGSHAVGFGRVTPTAVLGQPLQVSIPLRVESGERMFAECVVAEVTAGEVLLSPSQVRVQVSPGASPLDWTAVITTTSPIEEPVVEVSVSAGCEKRFMRRFTAFADPPESVRRGVPSVLAANAVPLVSLPPSGPVARPAPRLPSEARAERPARASASTESAARPSRPVAAPKGPVRELAPAPAAPALAQAPAARRLEAATSETQVARLLLDVGGPRLKMDLDEPLMRAPAAALAAASLPPLSAGEDIARLQSLEKTLAELKKESQSARDTSSSLKSRLEEAESRSRLLPWLLGLLLLAAGLAVWLAVRLRRSTRAPAAEPQQWWASGAAPLDSMGPVPVPPPSIAGELIDEPMEPPAQRSGGGRIWAEPDSEEPPMQKTAAMPGPVGFGSVSGGGLDSMGGPAREVSVEELLDLEQQADFFIALGQEDAAVDLLMSHLRGTGGLSPLPYTKLLEIYKRQGDRGAYERIRARFNRRFNAYAPDWDVGPLQGRALEDYADIVLYLQSIWPSPLDAMAVLEGMLFRKDESQEMFDLPAYKDVLLLYSLARDLWQLGGPELTDVDVLLPLGEPAMATAPSIEVAPGHAYDLTSFELEPHSPPAAVAADATASLNGKSLSGDGDDFPPLTLDRR